jgi:hypothetical protein
VVFDAQTIDPKMPRWPDLAFASPRTIVMVAKKEDQSEPRKNKGLRETVPCSEKLFRA